MKLSERKLWTALNITLGVAALAAVAASIIFGTQRLLNLGLALGVFGWLMKIITFYYDRNKADN